MFLRERALHIIDKEVNLFPVVYNLLEVDYILQKYDVGEEGNQEIYDTCKNRFLTECLRSKIHIADLKDDLDIELLLHETFQAIGEKFSSDKTLSFYFLSFWALILVNPKTFKRYYFDKKLNYDEFSVYYEDTVKPFGEKLLESAINEADLDKEKEIILVAHRILSDKKITEYLNEASMFDGGDKKKFKEFKNFNETKANLPKKNNILAGMLYVFLKSKGITVTPSLGHKDHFAKAHILMHQPKENDMAKNRDYELAVEELKKISESLSINTAGLKNLYKNISLKGNVATKGTIQDYIGDKFNIKETGKSNSNKTPKIIQDIISCLKYSDAMTDELSQQIDHLKEKMTQYFK